MNAGTPNSDATPPRHVPAWRWLRDVRPGSIRADLVAGFTLAAYVLPAGIGDATLAGLPPEAGLYACTFSGLVFWLFCSSRLTTVTATSAISLVVGTSLAPMSHGHPTRHAALAACLAILVGVIAFAAWCIKGGAIVNFISESAMVGFKSGLALYLASTQLPKLCGFHGNHGDFWERSHYFIAHASETSIPSLITGLSALALLVLGTIYFRHKPVALFVVIGAIAASSILGLEAHGVKMLGAVPRGLPVPGLPAIQAQDLNDLLPLALACFVLGAVETAAIGRMFAAKYGGRFDANQELLALSASNLAAGFGRSYPVSGGMSQSLVNESAGARTPLSGFIAAVLILLVAMFLSGLLHNLPQPALAAIVLFAVASLFKLEALTHLWRYYRDEFVVALAAMLGVLGSGLLRGVLIGAIISIIQLLRRASKPHVAILGRIPGTRRYSDIARHSDNEPVPGILICRPESALLYFNVDHVRDTIIHAVRAAPTKPATVLLDLSASPRVDVQAADTLASLQGDLAAEGCHFQIVEAYSSVRDTLRREGLEGKVGQINRFTSVADAVDKFLSAASKSQPDPAPAALH